jgi:hypothetical protein
MIGALVAIPWHSNVVASVIGEYYLQNFNGLNGERNITCYDDGINWLNINGLSSFSKVESGVYKLNATSAGSTAWFNFSQTTQINFTLTNANAALADYYLYFKTSSGDSIFTIYSFRAASGNGGAYIYSYSGATLYSESVSGDIGGVFKFTFHQENNSVFILIIGGNFAGSYWITNIPGSNFDITTHLKCTSQKDVTSTSGLTLDDIYFLSGVEYPWEITSDVTIGSLLQTDYANFSTSLTTIEPATLIEENPGMIYGPLYVRQFAFAVSSAITLSNFQIVLHLNGGDFGYYDNAYYYGGSINIAPRYILVWEDINQSFDTLLIEIAVNRVVTSTFIYPVYEGDIDGDGQVGYWESLGVPSVVWPHYNGVFDGTNYYDNVEPMYKIWSGFSSSTTPCGIDFSGYASIGSLPTNDVLLIPNKFLEILYNVPSSLELHGVEILVNSGMGSMTYDYYLKVNGEPVGYADCVTPYTQDLNLVVWEYDELFFGETLLFEFLASSVPYWTVASSDIPIDDGEVGVRAHSTYTMFDGVYNGDSVARDIAYRFYYGGFFIPNATSPSPVCLITTPKTEWYRYDYIPVYWEVNDSAYPAYIYLYKDGVQYDDGVFPLELSLGQFSGDTGYFAFYDGEYKFSIIRSGTTFVSCNVTVVNRTGEDYVLSSHPNPYDYNTEFTIFYRFFLTTGFDGLIAVSTSTSINDSVNTWSITANSTGNLSYLGVDDYYIMLYTMTGTGIYYKLKTVFQQLIQETDDIRVTPGDAVIEEGGRILETISGHQKHFGFDVVVRLDNEVIKHVGGSSFYMIETYVSTPGPHNATLTMETSNGTVVLDYFNFIITGPTPGGEQQGDDPWAILGVYKYVFAIGIIVMFLLLPMTVASRLGIDLPMLLNIGSAALGLSFCILSGLLPIWVAFLTAVAMIVAAVFVMFGR